MTDYSMSSTDWRNPFRGLRVNSGIGGHAIVEQACTELVEVLPLLRWQSSFSTHERQVAHNALSGAGSQKSNKANYGVIGRRYANN